jgi:hypothetical protein
MDQTTQQNASLVEEAAAASKSIVERVNGLDGLISRYILGDNSHSAEMRRHPGALAA